MVFAHLPPATRHLSGELCCTADLVLTGDTLRQAVVEVRQLMARLRLEGGSGFGLLGTSYGGGAAATCIRHERFPATLTRCLQGESATDIA